MPNTPVNPNHAAIAFGSPIPGQSWSTHPPRSTPWQKPTKFTELDKAMEWLFDSLLEPQHLKVLLNLMDGGMSIEATARTILFTGFTMGLWTPTLMMLMYKPTMLTLIAVAHRAGLHHTPVVLPEAFNKYHDAKAQSFGTMNRAKKVAQQTGNLPANLQNPITPVAKPAAEESNSSPVGFMQKPGGSI